MVRLQCPHLALAAPAPQLSSPSVQSANVRRSLSSRSVQQFIPRPCVRSLHSLPGLYRVMRASRSKVTPFPWCCCSWPHSATLGRALLGGLTGGGDPPAGVVLSCQKEPCPPPLPDSHATSRGSTPPRPRVYRTRGTEMGHGTGPGRTRPAGGGGSPQPAPGCILERASCTRTEWEGGRAGLCIKMGSSQSCVW